MMRLAAREARDENGRPTLSREEISASAYIRIPRVGSPLVKVPLTGRLARLEKDD